MKIYMYYIRPSDERPGQEYTGTKVLYALTNKKKMAKSFENTRKMEIFEKRTTHMSLSEYSSIAGEERESVLEWCKFRSRSKYPKNMNETFGDCVEEFKFPVTYLEVQCVKDGCETAFEHSDIDIPNPLFFNKQLRLIFKRFGLDHMFKLTRFPYLGDDIMYCTEEEIVNRSQNQKMKYSDATFLRSEMDYEQPDIWVDELSIFLEMYSHLMNI